jgi:3-hydroxyacyl-[acyl-carrier-protein] dehydratase
MELKIAQQEGVTIEIERILQMIPHRYPFLMIDRVVEVVPDATAIGIKAEGKLVYFMTVDNARFRRPVMPGDQLRIHVSKERSRGNVWKFSGEAKVNGTLVAEATYAAMIMDG